MPLYDYQCDSCSHEEEILQGVNDARLTECPSCQEPQFKRKASAPSFTFKGGGWYKDLYGSSGSGKPAPTKSESSSSTKTETSKATANK